MVSRERKKAARLEKLQMFRSMANSRALNKTSIIVDACKYIKELKQKVERLNQNLPSAQNSKDQDKTANFPMQVTVETLENGFLINVFSEKSCPGLLVSLLEVFEELRLNVLQARVSCTENFQLEAVGEQAYSGSISAQVVKQSVVQAINTWMESNEQDE